MKSPFFSLCITATAITTILVGVQAADGDADLYYLTSSSIRNKATGTESGIEYAVSRERLTNTPNWTPQLSPVPLPPDEASRIASKWFTTKYPSLKDVAIISSVDLDPIQLTDFKKWRYTIVFHVPSESATKDLPERLLFCMLLLDGSVVEPIFTGKPPKWSSSPFIRKP